VQPNDDRHRDVAVIAAVLAEYERGRTAASTAGSGAADGGTGDAAVLAWRRALGGGWTRR
jgi:hypothetical protein